MSDRTTHSCGGSKKSLQDSPADMQWVFEQAKADGARHINCRILHSVHACTDLYLHAEMLLQCMLGWEKEVEGVQWCSCSLCMETILGYLLTCWGKSTNSEKCHRSHRLKVVLQTFWKTTICTHTHTFNLIYHDLMLHIFPCELHIRMIRDGCENYWKPCLGHRDRIVQLLLEFQAWPISWLWEL